MGDCPGAGSGDSRGYDHRSLREIRSDNIAEAREWIKDQGFKVVRVGIPEYSEYFVNYKIEEDCQFHWFVTKDRKILKAEYAQMFGSIEMISVNFDSNYRYYVVEKAKSNTPIKPTPKAGG